MTEIEAHLLGHLDEFVGFARRRLANPDLAADAVQESLMKALRASEQIRDQESVKAWFYKILRRTIIDLYRRRDAQDRALERYQVDADLTPSEDEERVVCACIERLIPTLPPQYAVLIRRLDLEGEAPESLTASLGISKNNLNVRLHRARRRLKNRLEETCRMCVRHGCLDCHCSQS